MKTISIINDCGYYNDRTPFLLTDGTVELSVELLPVCGEFYLVGKNNSIPTDKIKIVAGQQIVIKELKAGVFTSAIKHYLRGELIEIYPVETLVLKDVDGKVYGVPEIKELNERLAYAEKQIACLNETNITLTEAVKKLHERLKNLEKINEGD